MKTTEGRKFETGAYRDTAEGKFDYEGFLSPQVIERYAAYMHKNREQSNGEMRDADNWQAGIPQDVYMKSAWRHFMDLWLIHRGVDVECGKEEALCALMFNIQGMLFEELRGSESAKLEAAFTEALKAPPKAQDGSERLMTYKEWCDDVKIGGSL